MTIRSHPGRPCAAVRLAAFAAVLVVTAVAKAGTPPPTCAVPTPLLEYRFDEAGSTAPSTGIDATPVILRNADGVAVDLHGAPGSGVSGSAGDRSFDNSDPTPPSVPGGVGMAGYGGRAEQPVDDDLADGLVSMTLAGWFQSDDAASITGNDARLFDKSDPFAPPDGGGWALAWSDAGELSFGVKSSAAPNGTGGGATSSPVFFSENQWVFFAVTFDGTASVENVRFYRGSQTEPAALVDSFSVELGAIDDATMHLSLGNSTNAVRAFEGQLDNLRLFGSAADSTGVLTLRQIESLRRDDLLPKPIVEYRFDETGTEAPSTGTDPTGASLRNADGVGVDSHGAAGSGVSGNPDDRAFDNRDATPPAHGGAVGLGAYGGRAEQLVDDDQLDSFVSFTVQGWIRSDDPPSVTGNGGRLVDKNDGAGPPDGGGWFLDWRDVGALSLQVKSDSVFVGVATSWSAYFSEGAWLYLAVSYDGTAASDNVKFYRGSLAEPVELVDSATIGAGALAGATMHLALGNATNAARAFPGELDDFRVFGSQSDAGGALSIADLEALRAADALGVAVSASDADGDGLLDGCDLTPPVLTPSIEGTLGDDGWYVSDVSISWQVDDPESPIDSIAGCAPESVTADTAGLDSACSATSEGGSTDDAVTVRRDATPPLATAAAGPPQNANGWRRTNVTVSFSATDATSGVAACDPPIVLSAEGADQSASGVCVDAAGNPSAPAIAGDIDIDKTPPEIAVVTPAPGAVYARNQVVLASYWCADALSGVATCAGPVADAQPIDTSRRLAKGRFTVTAVDRAGNTTRKTVVYSVR
jgi:hypothetical protein